jgi:hypothetical protein
VKKPKKNLLSNIISTYQGFKTMRSVQEKKPEDQSAYPVYFRYFRINEIAVALTYKHKESSLLNTKNLRIIIKPFIKHGKFVTFAKMVSKFEHFCNRSLIYQIPSIIKQKILKIGLNKDEDEDELDLKSGDLKIEKAKQILFGKFAQDA